MFRLLRIIVFVWLSFAAVLLTVYLTHINSEPPFKVLFTNPDGSPCQTPCLFGIRFGETTRDQAINMLKLHPLTHELKLVEGPSGRNGNGYTFAAQNSVIVFHIDSTDHVIHLWLFYHQGYLPYMYNQASMGILVPAVELEHILISLRLGEFTAFWGRPEGQLDCFWGTPNYSCTLGLVYNTGDDKVRVSTKVDFRGQNLKSITPEIQTSEIDFAFYSSGFGPNSNQSNIEWIGFAQGDRYVRQVYPEQFLGR